MAPVPPPFQTGQQLTARDLNALRDYLLATADRDGGDTAAPSTGPGPAPWGGLLASLLPMLTGGGSAEQQLVVLCRITRTLVDSEPVQDRPPTPATRVTYDLARIGMPGITFLDHTPVYGRPVLGDQPRIHPAPVGDTALILRGVLARTPGQPDLLLLPGSEIIAFKTCPEQEP